jgi:hypothetical protein
MSTSTLNPGLAQLREQHKRAEQLCEDAAEAERAAYLHWQEAYGAYELARDEATAACMAWVEALTP